MYNDNFFFQKSSGHVLVILVPTYIAMKGLKCEFRKNLSNGSLYHKTKLLAKFHTHVASTVPGIPHR